MPNEYKKIEEISDLSKMLMYDQRNFDTRRMLNFGVTFNSNYLHRSNDLIVELYKPGYSGCKDCGKIISKQLRMKHIKNHKQNEIVECSICNAPIKKRYLSTHLKACGNYPPGLSEQ